MNRLRYLTIGLFVVWAVTEVVVSITRRSRPGSKKYDKFSFFFVWLSCIASIITAVRVPEFHKVGRIVFLAPYLGYVGCLLIAAGIVIRWVAVVTLGRQFTTRVAILEDHTFIAHGIYQKIRHPSYLGFLMSFTGLSLALKDWICLAITFILPLAAIIYRISVKEKALLEHFGKEKEPEAQCIVEYSSLCNGNEGDGSWRNRFLKILIVLNFMLPIFNRGLNFIVINWALRFSGRRIRW